LGAPFYHTTYEAVKRIAQINLRIFAFFVRLG